MISAWVLIFYTRFCGLSAGQAALIFAVARILDAFVSPTIGHISDHFDRHALGRRFGRRRFFVLAAIPLLPSFALMIAICALEILVAGIQAYVFALLTSLYLNDAENLH